MTYSNHNFPCLVSYGAVVEDPNNASFDATERYNCIARNALRHLTYGVPLRESHILTWENFSALFIRRNDQLLTALKLELQNMFYNAFDCVTKNGMDQDAEKRLIIFIQLLLAMYPFLDPSEQALLKIPQKINGQWQLVNYVTERIDISPQNGVIANLITRNDRLYAYGLVPQDNTQAPTFLSIEGSAYPTAPGAKINWLYNFFPHYSVGEAHDFSLLDRWIKAHTNITTVGHSKGGTVAMILAALYPNAIKHALGLCPTALDNATFKRILSQWVAIPDDLKPNIDVYTQSGDPIFYLGKNFLPGTNIYLVNDAKGPTGKFSAHVHTIMGRESVIITKLNGTEYCFNSKWRDYFTSNKQALNWVVFPLLYSELIISLSMNRLKDFSRHKLALIFLDGFMTGFYIHTVSSVIGSPLPINFCIASGLAVTHLASKYAARGSKITSTIALSAMLALLFVATIATVAIAYAAKSSLSIFNRSDSDNDKHNDSDQPPPSSPRKTINNNPHTLRELRAKSHSTPTTKLLLTALNSIKARPQISRRQHQKDHAKKPVTTNDSPFQATTDETNKNKEKIIPTQTVSEYQIKKLI